MPALRPARTKIERSAADRARDIRGHVAQDVRRARQDAGLSLRSLAREAGISHATLHGLEGGTHDPTTEVLARVGAALGLDLSVRFFPNTGPLVRDHIQAAMIEALIGILHARWRPSPEVAVYRPVRGAIDLVLDSEAPAAAKEPLVACEAQSQLRRLEQQLRWSGAKADALAHTRSHPASRLLLLQSTKQTRAVVTEFAQTIGAAFPARAADAYTALSGTAAWPGPAIIWCDVVHGRARVRREPPRGIDVGR